MCKRQNNYHLTIISECQVSESAHKQMFDSADNIKSD